MSDEMLKLAEELREYTAMKYAGDCKCGKCQLVPRALVERIYHTLNAVAASAEPVACEDFRTLMIAEAHERYPQANGHSRPAFIAGAKWAATYTRPAPDAEIVAALELALSAFHEQGIADRVPITLRRIEAALTKLKG